MAQFDVPWTGYSFGKNRQFRHEARAEQKRDERASDLLGDLLEPDDTGELADLFLLVLT